MQTIKSQASGLLPILAAAIIVALPLGMARATVITEGCANIDVSCTLGELLFDEGVITVNDKTFLGFFQIGDLVEENVASPDGEIEIVGLDDGGLDPGPGLAWVFPEIVFTGVGELSFSIGGFVVVDIEGGFPPEIIKDNSLEIIITDNLGFGDDTQLSVEERLFAPNIAEINDFLDDLVENGPPDSEDFDALFEGDLIGTKDVFIDLDGGDPTFSLFDSLDFEPQGFLLFQTTFVITGASDEDGVQGLVVEQRFSQVSAPEPATLVVFGAGLAGLGWLRRRRKRAV